MNALLLHHTALYFTPAYPACISPSLFPRLSSHQEMRKYLDSNGTARRELHSLLAKDVLAEVPNQLVSWMRTHGYQPRPPTVQGPVNTYGLEYKLWRRCLCGRLGCSSEVNVRRVLGYECSLSVSSLRVYTCMTLVCCNRWWCLSVSPFPAHSLASSLTFTHALYSGPSDQEPISFQKAV